MTSPATKFIVTGLMAAILAACASGVPTAPILQTGDQVQLRSYQTRTFDTNDKAQVMRSVIATLQDLGFVIGNADFVLGSVTGSKFVGHKSMRMAVTVRPRSETQLLVRANAQFGLEPVERPQPYQSFFAAVGKSLFLTAQEVE